MLNSIKNFDHHISDTEEAQEENRIFFAIFGCKTANMSIEETSKTLGFGEMFVEMIYEMIDKDMVDMSYPTF